MPNQHEDFHATGYKIGDAVTVTLKNRAPRRAIVIGSGLDKNPGCVRLRYDGTGPTSASTVHRKFLCKISNTPRTDAAINGTRTTLEAADVLRDLCRELELENAALRSTSSNPEPNP